MAGKNLAVTSNGMDEYITKEKQKALSEELEILTKERRREVAEKLEYAKSLGDLSENAEYHEARDAQAAVEDRIKKIENILKNAVIVSHKHATDAVSVGSKIKIVKEGGKEEKEYTIVGAEESNVSQGKLSVRSPLGEALVGKKKGEKITFNAPSGSVAYKIISIE